MTGGQQESGQLEWWVSEDQTEEVIVESPLLGSVPGNEIHFLLGHHQHNKEVNPDVSFNQLKHREDMCLAPSQ